jgi:hypothetical protein
MRLAKLLRCQGSEFVAFARRANPEIPRLEAVLTQIESRLGTDAEQNGDFEECRDIAHRLAGLFCIGALVDFTPEQRIVLMPHLADRLAS